MATRGRPDGERPLVHISDDVVKELRATARPGKGEILVKVFSDAIAAFMEEDFDSAIKLGEQSKHMALRANSPREFLGLAFYHSGRWSDAARELAAYRRLSGSETQNAVLADCYRALDKPAKAVELCDEVGPDDVETAVYYETQIVGAGALADMGKLDDAIARLEQLDLQPRVAQEYHLRVWYVLGDLLERKGRFTQARSWFDAVASADADMTDAPERARKLSGKA